MDAIICVLTILSLSAVTFLLTAKKDARYPSKRPSTGGELHYLYIYKDILQQVATIERKMAGITQTVYFNQLDTAYLKQQIHGQTQALIAQYLRGHISGKEALAQLNELNARVQVLFPAIAA